MTTVNRTQPTPEAIAESNRIMNQYFGAGHVLSERQLDHLTRRADYYLRTLYPKLEVEHTTWSVGQCRPALGFVRIPSKHNRRLYQIYIAWCEFWAVLGMLGLELIAQDAWDELLERPMVRFWLRASREG